MRVLLDSCVWGSVRRELCEKGFDAVSAGEWAEDPGDEEILIRAHRDGRVLVTLDKDFGELAVFHGLAHSGILRVVNLSSQHQAIACIEALTRYADELANGSIVTVEPGWVRIRPPDS